MNNKELLGVLVVVHPDFKNDPIKKQGHVGVVTFPHNDAEIYVKFLGGAESKYSGENLFKLKDKQHVLDELMNNGPAMKTDDFKALYKIMLLQDRGTSKGLFDALEIARDNPAIWQQVLDPLKELRPLEMANALTR
jgi:hypothetical protein